MVWTAAASSTLQPAVLVQARLLSWYCGEPEDKKWTFPDESPHTLVESWA